MDEKKVDYDAAKEALVLAQDELTQANRALKQNRDESMVQELDMALRAAQAAFDDAEKASSLAQMFYEKLRDQQREDLNMHLEEMRQIADAERAGREGALMDSIAQWETEQGFKTSLEAELTAAQAAFITASDAGEPTQPFQDEIDRINGEISGVDGRITDLETTMNDLQADWDAAEADRMRLEDEAERAQENADWETAKQYYEEEEARFQALEREVEEWRGLRDQEPDLVLW